MVQEGLNISAEELFGAASSLAVQEGGALSSLATLGPYYQLATAVVALLFLFIAVSYADLYLYLVQSLFTTRIKSSDIHIYSADINNIKIFTSIVGVVFITLLVIRFSIMEQFAPLFYPLSSLSTWELGGVVLCSLFALILGEQVLLYIVGFVSGNLEWSRAIWHAKLLNFTITIISIIPLAILVLLGSDKVATNTLYISVAVCSISLFMFVKETFSLFRTQRFSIFHWILYLCALEILPLSLLLAPILRG